MSRKITKKKLYKEVRLCWMDKVNVESPYRFKSALESIIRWRLSAIIVYIGLDWIVNVNSHQMKWIAIPSINFTFQTGPWTPFNDGCPQIDLERGVEGHILIHHWNLCVRCTWYGTISPIMMQRKLSLKNSLQNLISSWSSRGKHILKI